MKKTLLIGLGLVMLMASFGYATDEPAKAPTAVPAPPVAGSETLVLGVTVTELTMWLMVGASRKVLGKKVYNDKKESWHGG